MKIRITYLPILLSFLMSWFSFTAKGQTDHTQFTVDESMFLYDTASFPSCHASTILETKRGTLLAAYFGGQYEGSPDVKIWLSRRNKGHKAWQQQMVANGEGTACYNPVLTQLPDGTIILFYKIGKNVQAWTGWYKTSTDDGITWSAPHALPHGFLGPIKDKPIVTDRYLLCPSSKEKDHWRVHFELFDLSTHQWSYVGPLQAEQSIPTMDRPGGAPQPIICIQPTIITLPDGTLQALCRTKNSALATTYSADKGRSWTPVTLTDIPNNNSGVDAVTLHDGRHVLVYNDIAAKDGEDMAARNRLSLALFSPDMTQMLQTFTLEDTAEGEYSYPAIVEAADHSLLITYTWHREKIAFRRISLH